MKYEFQYYFSQAKSVAVIGDFNGWQGEKNIMDMDDEGVWRTEIELEPGEYYYRYLIDNSFELNDPYANMYLPDQKERLASLLIINEDGQHMINTTEYEIHFENYSLINNISEDIPVDKKIEYTYEDEKVVAYLRFTRVTGMHAITFLWYCPDGLLYHVEDGIIYQDEDEPLITWFWLNLDETMPVGKWVIKAYINGTFIFEDSFKLKPLSNISGEHIVDFHV